MARWFAALHPRRVHLMHHLERKRRMSRQVGSLSPACRCGHCRGSSLRPSILVHAPEFLSTCQRAYPPCAARSGYGHPPRHSGRFLAGIHGFEAAKKGKSRIPHQKRRRNDETGESREASEVGTGRRARQRTGGRGCEAQSDSQLCVVESTLLNYAVTKAPFRLCQIVRQALRGNYSQGSHERS